MSKSKQDAYRTKIGEQTLRPESLMMSYGYRPELSEGSIKCPIFQTSTFVFKTAEEGKAFFELAYGLRKRDPGEEMGLIYSRVNNPDLEVLEDRLTVWDGAEEAAVFSSGMAAISTTLLSHLRPGDVVIHSEPSLRRHRFPTQTCAARPTASSRSASWQATDWTIWRR